MTENIEMLHLDFAMDAINLESANAFNANQMNVDHINTADAMNTNAFMQMR